MELGDSHTHLSDYTAEDVGAVLERARLADVCILVAAGTSVESSAASVTLAGAHDGVYAGVGIHPTELKGPVDDATYAALHDVALSSPKVVCISEVGLDFLPTSPPAEVQYQAFREQIRLALELRLPVIFHSRESHPEVLRTLREEGAARVGGAMHYFQADLKTAREATEMGFFISLAKPLLRLTELQEVARQLPLESIVLETDSAPQPWKKYRKNWTEPQHVRMVADKLAELKAVSTEEVASVTTANLRRLLKLTRG